MAILIICILLAMALVAMAVETSGEVADKVGTKDAHGASFGFGCLMIPVILILAYLGLSASLAIIPDADRQQAREQRQEIVSTPQSEQQPAQWSNAYWEDKAAAREARDAQYRP